MYMYIYLYLSINNFAPRNPVHRNEGTSMEGCVYKEVYYNYGAIVGECVPRTGNMAGLRLLVLGLCAMLVGPWLASGNLAGKQFPTLI